jgi:CMP-N-acetylneuraminic acid synthetase
MMKKHRLVALLPMKANSERVRGKNFRPLAGKPLYRWMLDTLLSLEEVDKVVINTDARQQLLASGLEQGDRVLIRDRRPEICGDDVSMNLIIRDDIDNVSSDTYLMTHTTNPLLSADTLRQALETFWENSSADSLFSVNRFQTRFYREDGSPVNHDPNNLIKTQDLEPWYEENSCLYLFTRDSFDASQARIGRRAIMFETPKMESVDIDEEEDWRLAEALASS